MSHFRRITFLCAVLAAGTSALAPSVAHAGPRVASMYCSSDSSAQSDVQKKLQSSGLFDVVDNLDMGVAAPSLATLRRYDALLIWADTSRGCSDPTNTGNVVAQYIDAGGGVVQILPYYLGYTYSNIAGDFYARYSLVNQGTMRYVSAFSLGSKLEMHPILSGVGTVGLARSGYLRTTLGSADLRNGGRVIVTWSDGSGLAVVGAPGGHNRVDLNLGAVSSDVSSGYTDAHSDAYKLVAQALAWTVTGALTTDMGGVADLGGAPDLGGVPDMAMGGGDMAMSVPDMAMGGGDMAMSVPDMARPRDMMVPVDDFGISGPQPPRVLDIQPRHVAFGAGGQARISGRNFAYTAPTAQVFLSGDRGLLAIGNTLVIDEGTIQIGVPADLAIGLYAVIVKNPDGQIGTLSDAFLVTDSAPGGCSMGQRQRTGLGAGCGVSLVIVLGAVARRRARRRSPR